jgi:DNA-binding winged helix-turn-helix (wHTH) protein
MRVISNVFVFEADYIFSAVLKGYCYANKVNFSEKGFDDEGIEEAIKVGPSLIFLPIDILRSNQSKTEVLKALKGNDGTVICGLLDSDVIDSDDLDDLIDIRLVTTSDISEIDAFIKRHFLLLNYGLQDRRCTERRSMGNRRVASIADILGGTRRPTGLSHQTYDDDACKNERLRIDHRNKCLFLNGKKVDLTRKEYALFELLSTDTDRVFAADEIIDYLWPENNRATKSDLYQYMHLLRKKVEKDPNNPRWILTIKGFGYRLNLNASEILREEVL